MPQPEIRTGAGEKLKRNERNNLRMKEGTVPELREGNPVYRKVQVESAMNSKKPAALVRAQ